eukprot:TRINITY_DN1042_c0_g1_i3.p1 TRINITY_DN1042_c0_g1~~TRINITY_DN1042_c0_g1_i3.p1  ORF type:complete len:129 (-),score=39.18 TRINITY_DN1042_c0_g1_i3:41-394(-)
MGMREENALLREETGAARRELLGAQREKSLLESELGKRGDRVVQLQHELSQSAIAREGYRNQLEREGGELSRKNHELMMRIQELDSLHTVSYTHLRAHETGRNLVCRLLLEKKKSTI